MAFSQIKRVLAPPHPLRKKNICLNSFQTLFWPAENVSTTEIILALDKNVRPYSCSKPEAVSYILLRTLWTVLITEGETTTETVWCMVGCSFSVSLFRQNAGFKGPTRCRVLQGCETRVNSRRSTFAIWRKVVVSGKSIQSDSVLVFEKFRELFTFCCEKFSTSTAG